MLTSLYSGGPTYGVESESLVSSDAAAMTKSDDYDDTESSITSVSEAAAKRRQKEIRMRMNGAYPGSWPFNPIILILLVVFPLFGFIAFVLNLH